MKTSTKNLFLLPALIAGFGLLPASRLAGQTFTPLCAAPGSPAGITLGDGTLFGVTVGGGTSGSGTIFSVATNGANFTVLHNFSAYSHGTNSDGEYLLGAPVLSGGVLYGAAPYGGTLGSGTIYAISTNGTGFTVLYTFSAVPSTAPSANNDGFAPFAGLLLSGDTLYGTTAGGGTNGFGAVFSIKTNGSGFATLHSFADGNANRDSSASLVLSGNTLYGTTRYGGTSLAGTVFAVDTDGNNFTVLHNFAGSDGGRPIAGLTLSGGALYGVTSSTAFKLNLNGSGFTVLHTFTGYPSDGRAPEAGLAVVGNTLYGTTFGGGTVGDNGTIFSISTSGSDYNVLYSFTASGNNGNYPEATLIPSGTTLYGTALDTPGIVFTFVPGCSPADLSIAQYAGVSISGSIGCTYEIDYTTNLNNPTWIPLTTNILSSNPFLFIDTNAISGTRFYRAVTQ